MILTRIDPVQAGIERFTTRRMTAERLTSTHYPEIRRLHLHPQVMKTLSPDGQILPDNVTKEGLVQNDAHWSRARLRVLDLPGQGGRTVPRPGRVEVVHD